MTPRHIHFIGVGGIATSALAVALHGRGLRVSGSDEQILPPADHILAEGGLVVPDGFTPDRVADSVDLAVIGGMIGRGNPEVEEVLRRRIPVTTWPRLLQDLGFLAGRNGVVAGTDGKTTTTCMWSWILEKTGRSADYVVGGRVPQWSHGVRLQGAPYCVLEGDEYPSGFGDRNPKFAHYRPEVAILTNIHFDHPDVYASPAALLKSFRLLTDLLPSDGLLIHAAQDRNCSKLAASAKCGTLSFGFGKAAQVPIRKLRHGAHGTTFQIRGCDFSLSVLGAMNALNATAAALAAEHWGVPLAEAAGALESFPGAVGRQTRHRYDERLVLITDTAYHPHAVGLLLEALKQHFPDRSVGLVLQPRHTQGPANWQQKLWPRELMKASRVILMDDMNLSNGIPSRFSSRKVAEDTNRKGGHVILAEDAPAAADTFARLVSPKDVWALCLQDWFPEPRGQILNHALEF